MQESGVHSSILQFEVDFEQHDDLITMMVFTLLHFMFFLLCYISFLMRHKTCACNRLWLLNGF